MVKAFLILLLFNTALAQEDYPVKKLWLFSKKEYNGNVPRQRNGKPGKGYNQKILCYIEIEKNKPAPEWQKAVVYGKQYTVETVPANSDSVQVGVLKNTNTEVVIKAEPGYKLIGLNLTQPVDISGSGSVPVVLTGLLSGKATTIHSREVLVELTPEMMP